jgi:hypothetical protein
MPKYHPSANRREGYCPAPIGKNVAILSVFSEAPHFKKYQKGQGPVKNLKFSAVPIVFMRSPTILILAKLKLMPQSF